MATTNKVIDGADKKERSTAPVRSIVQQLESKLFDSLFVDNNGSWTLRWGEYDQEMKDQWRENTKYLDRGRYNREGFFYSIIAASIVVGRAW